MEGPDHINTVVADRFHDLMQQVHRLRPCQREKLNYGLLNPILEACECCLNILSDRLPDWERNDNMHTFREACEELERTARRNKLLRREYACLHRLQQLCQQTYNLEPEGFKIKTPKRTYYHAPCELMDFRYVLVF